MNCTEMEYLFHHIFLPPRVPDGDQFTNHGVLSQAHDTQLLGTVLDSLRIFKNSVNGLHAQSVESVIFMVQGLLNTRDAAGHLNRLALGDALAGLVKPG